MVSPEGMIQQAYHRIKPFINRFKRAYHLIDEERNLRTTFDMPTRTRLWLYLHGFTSRAAMLYDLRDEGTDAYLSDWDRYIKSPEINGDWNVFLDNKIVFHHLLSEYDEHRVPIYGILDQGRIHPSEGTTERGLNAGRWVRHILEKDGALVVKPITGGGGKNVLVCRVVEDEYQVNGTVHSAKEFESRVGDLDGYIVCEFVEQTSYAQNLYPATPNTIRVLTMVCPKTGNPFLARAIQRMGADGTGPIDNFSSGGLSAKIETTTGKLGTAVQYPHPDRTMNVEVDSLEWHETHPDSGAIIAGTVIPGWEQIRERLLEIACEFSYIPYVGWDIIVTDDSGSFKIIEANSHSGVKSLQVHGPLLTDERVRDFYKAYDVIK